MKIIEALKQEKDLARKVSDLKDKVAKNCAISTVETETYSDQREQVGSWLQSIHDVLKERERLRLAIQRTNLATDVTIEIGGATVTKSIAAWIHRRRDLSRFECEAWQALTDRNIREGQTQGPSGATVIDIKIKRFYDPLERDKNVELFTTEPTLIDARLEIVNAVTDLIE